MKMCFIFDTVMLKDENDNYYAINLNYKLWQDRYLKVFDSIIVSTRSQEMPLEEIKLKKGYTLANGKNVEIRPISEYNKIVDVLFKKNKIEKQLKEIISKVDAVIVRLPSPLGSLACNVCRKMGKKYAIEVVACAWDGYRHHGHWAGKIVAPLMYLSTRKQCKKSTTTLYVTEKFLQKRYPTYGETTNASNVMISETGEDILIKRLNKIKKFEASKTKLGLVGPYELKSKGHEIALKALSIIKKKYPNVIIEFLGNGTGNKLKKIVQKKHLEENVRFIGTLPAGEEVFKWMDNIDILVIPSFQEGLPRVLIEAMSRACPAVGARTGGIPELLSDNFIHKAGDYHKLSEDIISLIENKKELEAQAKKNFYESKKYSKEILDEKRRKFWEEFRDK